MSLHSLCKVLFTRFLYGTMFHRLVARVLYIPTVIRLLLKQKVSFYNWYDRIDDTVILGALPFRSMTKELVKGERVRAILSYNQDYELKLFTNSSKDWDTNGVQQYIYPTWDFTPPSQEHIVQGLSVIDRERANKHCVYVHCKAGKGRSATVVACYVIKRYKMVPDDAIDFIERIRPQISMNEHQRKAITEFYENLLYKKN